MKGSYKILLLLLGILVALVVTLTTWVYLDKPEVGNTPLEKPTTLSTPNTSVQKVIEIIPTLLSATK